MPADTPAEDTPAADLPAARGRSAAPSVTVVVACYRQAALVEGCVRSVAAQTRPAERFVLLDDASGDGSADALRAAAAAHLDPARTVVIDSGPNAGLAARLDQALEVVDTDWFLVVAADDELVPGTLEVLTASAAAHPGCAVHFGDLDVVDVAGRPLGYRRPAQTWQGAVARRYLTPARPWLDLLTWNNFVPGGMTMVSAAAVRAAGGFRAEVRTTEDFDLWLRLGREHPFRYTGRTVGRYRVVPTSKSRNEPVSVLDHASIVGRAAASAPAATRRRASRRAARLVALRWSLAVGRSRGRPPVTLAAAARAAGMSPRAVAAAVPAALALPAAGWARTRLASRAGQGGAA
ncbi:hypothetical protein NUM3379_29590 [Kineococcus sp. NUM-3379]